MSRRDQFLALRSQAPVVLPSLLQCDFGNLQEEVRRLSSAGIQAFHLDVMDGCFVPNLTYGMPIVSALRRLTQAPLDVHLMIQHPEQYIEQFVAAGADCVTVHIEACPEPRELLRRLRTWDVAAGIALNPATSLDTLSDCLDLCDLILVMSVPAGFGGQAFHESALEKLSALRDIDGGRLLLEVDGGVNRATVGRCRTAGADLLVAGSAIFGSSDYRQAIGELADLASVA